VGAAAGAAPFWREEPAARVGVLPEFIHDVDSSEMRVEDGSPGLGLGTLPKLA
jgi:hypothetical protein